MTLTIGDSCERLGQLTHPPMQAYAKRLGADFLVLSKRTLPDHPIWEKLQLFGVLGCYDRVIYMDTDLLVRVDCPNLFELVPVESIGAFNETDYLPVDHHFRPARKYYRMPLEHWDGTYYNAGLLVLSQAHRHWFELPQHRADDYLWDQGYLNCLWHAQGALVFHLSYRYNHLLHPRMPQDRENSYILHHNGSCHPTFDRRIPQIEVDLHNWRKRGLY